MGHCRSSCYVLGGRPRGHVRAGRPSGDCPTAGWLPPAACLIACLSHALPHKDQSAPSCTCLTTPLTHHTTTHAGHSSHPSHHHTCRSLLSPSTPPHMQVTHLTHHTTTHAGHSSHPSHHHTCRSLISPITPPHMLTCGSLLSLLSLVTTPTHAGH